MLLRISHHTRYDYAREVSFAPHLLYLRPRETPLQRLRSFKCNVAPQARLLSTVDAQDNCALWAHFWEKSSALNLRSECEVETLSANPFDFLLRPAAAKFPFAYTPADRFALGPYLAPPFDRTQVRLREWLAAQLPEPPEETVAFLTALNGAIHRSIAYVRREQGAIQPSAETLALGSGSCRDSAVLLIELCRTLGLAARFISGYLYDPPPPEEKNPVPGAMHAWVEVYLPGAGWKGLDPTRDMFCDDTFVPVAHAAQADNANPIQGNYYASGPVSSKLTTSVVVEKLA
ncbi:MAG TPA: transglutaminase family protein [Opitutaceae bacterium]|nr:transglutaminase family protein [Opitutaceae bacterium]